MKKPLTVPDVIEAIQESRGNLATVGRRFGGTRQAVSHFCLAHPTCKAAHDEAREVMLDAAEDVLYQKVLEGSTPELLFFLKTQGRSRGYIERAEVDHRGSIGTYLVDIGGEDDAS